MPRLDQIAATVLFLERADADAVFATARADGEETTRRIVAYPRLTGPLAVGDRVRLNATATALGLGTGGVDFVVAVEGRSLPASFGDPDGDEHLVKLRYTPLQHAVRPAEFDPTMADARTLDGLPVVACLLHSQIAPVAAGVKAARPDARIAYVWTDAAALPLAFSNLVRQLRDAGLIDATLTCGQAFGGDWECVTLASGLVAAGTLARADVAIVAQGPGNAGTGTPLGFSGIEQAAALDTVGALGGQAVAALRLSDADPRERHRGLSHHSATVLETLTARRATLAVPAGWPEIEASLRARLAPRHAIAVADGAPGLALLAARGVRVSSMGRGPDDDPLFFHAAAAAGATAQERSGGPERQTVG